MKTVCFIIAMDQEAMPFVEAEKLVENAAVQLPMTPARVFSGEVQGAQVHVVINGQDGVHGVPAVGTVPAALTTYAAVQALRPDLLVNAGTAGGFKARGAAIGDIYLSSAVRNHDRRIPLPGFDKYGDYHIKARDAVDVEALAKRLGFKMGVVTTGNSLDATTACMERMMGAEASVKEMEAAAFAYVAEAADVPWFCLKSVTDIVDGDKPTEDEFLENLGAAAKSLQEALPRVLEAVAGKELSAVE